MPNTIAYDIVISIFCGAAVAILAWVLIDGLRTGKLPVRYGGSLRRDKHPVGFALMIAWMTILMCVAAYGVIVLLRDAIYR